MADPTSGDPSDIWQHGREYGAAEALDKLEGLLRAGWEVWPNNTDLIVLRSPAGPPYYRGATLAEALALVPEE